MSNVVLDNIYSRRSVRKYTEEQVPDDLLNEIIKTGFHAANGMNAQAVRFSVVQDRKVIDDYNEKGKELFLKMAGGNEHVEKMLSNPDYNIFSNAPTVIFVFADQGAATPVEDVSLAIGNMMLSARSFGLGTCWIGFAAGLSGYDKFVKDNKCDGMQHLGTMIIGYPAKDSGPTPRGEPKILNWICA